MDNEQQRYATVEACLRTRIILREMEFKSQLKKKELSLRALAGILVDGKNLSTEKHAEQILSNYIHMLMWENP